MIETLAGKARFTLARNKSEGLRMLESVSVPIVTVGYRNAEDVARCLGSLAQLDPTPSFAVLICENGGPAAFERLLLALAAPEGPCPGDAVDISIPSAGFLRMRRLRLKTGIADVIVAEAKENVGYAGGINAWLEILATTPDWEGVWIVNPDATPLPNALAELVKCAKLRGKGMVGSRVLIGGDTGIVDSRGLKWRKWLASTKGVDLRASAAIEPDLNELESRMDSATGASVFVTRDCIERVGLMDERFFLYYEDLDWGLRAKEACGVSYAHHSIVPHEGGTTIGSGRDRSSRSKLSVYLDFRNRLIFVRKHYPAWYAWTILVCAARAAEFLAVGKGEVFRAALSGLWAGIRGETGRPDRLFTT